MKALGSTIITAGHRIQLVKKARELLGAKEGDVLIFYEDKGEVLVRKG